MFLMADDKAKPDINDFVKQWAQAQQRAEENLRQDGFQRQPQLLLQQGNCIRCHDRGPGLGRPIDRPFLDVPRLNIKGFDDVPQKPVDAAELERRVVEKFKNQPIIDQAVTILNRLPQKVDITVDKDKIAIATDFAKALEAIPGVKLDDEAKGYLSHVKSIAFENGKYKIQLDKAIPFGEGFGSLGPEISFEVKYDPSKKDGVGLKNVKGVTVLAMPVEELSVITDGGKHVVKAQCDVFGRKVHKDIDLAKFNCNGELLKQAIGQLAEYQPMIQNRDFGKFTNEIPEGFRNTITDMLKGVTSVSKDGDTFKLMRNNGVTKFDFGGPTISVSPEVSFKLGANADTPAIKDLRGLTVSIPLPEKLEMGSKYITNIKGVSLGFAERDGGRSLRIDADNLIDTVRVSLDKNFHPRKDGGGNWNLGLGGNNPLSPDGRKDRMNLNIRMGADGQVNMKASEVLDIVSDLTWQASDRSITGVSLGYSSVITRVSSWISSWFE